jgi:dolichol-phosphate mannosyltransferase
MKPAKPDLAFLGSAQLIVVCLLTAVIDIAVFQYLYIRPDALAFAHIASFLTASAIGYLSISLWPSHDAEDKTRVSQFKSSQLTTFVMMALLVIFLRGGLLASMLNIMTIPALAAISISAIFSSVALYAAYLYIQRTSVLSAEIRWGSLCLGIVGYTILLKLFYLGVPELIFEEAYYWNYAQHLDIGYLDHPLIVAWIIKTFTNLMGDIEFAVRFGAFLCWFVTAYYSYRLTKEIFNQSIAYWALVIVAVLPAYFSFGWFMSPDAPLSACWAAAIYYIHQVVVREDKRAWLGVGIAIGLGMSSKYTIVLLGTAIVLFLLFDRNARKWLSRPEPYIALAIAFILFSPVVIWNIQHDWLSFTFQSQGRLSSSHSFSLPRFISNLLIFLTPTGFLTVIAIALFRKNLLSVADKSHVPDIGTLAQSYLLLAWLTLFPVAVFASLSLFRASKLNWTGPCWLGLIPFVALLITQKPDSGTPRLLAWSQRAWPATIVILLFAYGAAFHYLGIGFPRTPYPQNVHLIGWQDFGRDIDVLATELERETGAEVLVVGMDRNKIASGLAFYRAKYLNSSPEKATHDPAMQTASTHLFGGNGLMYELWFPVEKQHNKTMLLVSEDIKDLTDEDVLSRVQTAGEIKDIKTWKGGKQTGHYYYRLVTGYHSKPVASKPDASAPID